MFKKTLFSILLSSVTAVSAQEASEPNIYIIPKDVNCVVRRLDKVTYCTDKNTGLPVTGEMYKYREGRKIQFYPMENGVLEGTAVKYYLSGGVQSEKNYKQGQLDGVVKNYYSHGVLSSEETYVSGKKEGISRTYDDKGNLLGQAIYIEGQLNGEMRLYDRSGQQLYSFNTSEDKLVSGSYYFKDADKILVTEIPPTIIAALNNKCLELQTEFTEDSCAVVFKGTVPGCNEKWRTANRQYVRAYLAKCGEIHND